MLQRCRPYASAGNTVRLRNAHLRCTAVATVVVIIGVRSVINHMSYLSLLLLCVTGPRSVVDRNVKIVWIKYQYLNTQNISDVMCFFPKTHTRNLDIRQYAENTDNITTPHMAAEAAAGHTMSVCQVCGVLMWLVVPSEDAIRHQSSPTLSFAVLCMCAVCRAHREIRTWIFGDMVK